MQEQKLEAAEVINGVITPELIIRYLTKLQDPAPTTSVLHTRTPIIRNLLLEAGISTDQIASRFLGTRSPAVLLDSPRKIWFDAHSDQPTYIPPITNENTFNIVPICAHSPKEAAAYPEHPASVLRFNSQQQIYEVISTGVIGTHVKTRQPYYTATTKPQNGFISGTDRIVYTPNFALDQETGLASGNMDNAAGITVSIAAIHALVELAKRRNTQVSAFGVGWIFPDEEEGLPQASAFFAREARRIIHRTPVDVLPKVIVNIDGHDTIRDADPQPLAVYSSFVSNGKGPILPPDVYLEVAEFLQRLTGYGVAVQPTEAVGRLSRSDDAGLMEVHNQIIPVGYLVRDAHHNKGIATVNIEGLVNTAKTIAWIASKWGVTKSEF